MCLAIRDGTAEHVCTASLTALRQPEPLWDDVSSPVHPIEDQRLRSLLGVGATSSSTALAALVRKSSRSLTRMLTTPRSPSSARTLDTAALDCRAQRDFLDYDRALLRDEHLARSGVRSSHRQAGVEAAGA